MQRLLHHLGRSDSAERATVRGQTKVNELPQTLHRRDYVSRGSAGVKEAPILSVPGEDVMSLALVAALTGLCFAGGVAALAFALSR